ncbi:DUF805 domain-containing protein [Cellulomonas sp. PhB143]|uniref:DUF805 domain-containing protein n=1 Tax=Cellulomonas sp. PhB143 TaxID=2485186 RepID=UPI000F487E26|nr:DUF805 domain-containing protein [Cellulomonas sp. PhB143]ROS75340.1 uncharacterized membrane protein YhaH (DUF805 family) [Cellulomonas sp. PhB143]
MSFGDAVRSVLSQYAGFSGRARRSEYWFFYLAVIIVEIVVGIVDNVLGTGGLLTGLVLLALILPSLAVAVRRLHDTDRTGWWILIGLIPIVGTIVLLVFYVSDSTPGPNRFGPSPKQVGAPVW